MYKRSVEDLNYMISIELISIHSASPSSLCNYSIYGDIITQNHSMQIIEDNKLL